MLMFMIKNNALCGTACTPRMAKQARDACRGQMTRPPPCPPSRPPASLGNRKLPAGKPALGQCTFMAKAESVVRMRGADVLGKHDKSHLAGSGETGQIVLLFVQASGAIMMHVQDCMEIAAGFAHLDAELGWHKFDTFATCQWTGRGNKRWQSLWNRVATVWTTTGHTEGQRPSRWKSSALGTLCDICWSDLMRGLPP
ncbi:hypothetical protein BCR44DRAFT_1436435, partial [Catenaria anguillulae PL171]